MQWLASIIIIFCYFIIISPVNAVEIFYISTQGNDKWSGRIPEMNIEKNDGPFATLERARDAIRILKKQKYNDTFEIQVRGGVYNLNKTFVLNQQDSGTEISPLVVKAYKNEQPILRGSIKINNFEPYNSSIYKADLSNMLPDGAKLRQLFVQGKRQTMARYPNIDQDNPVKSSFLYVDHPTEEGSKVSFVYQPSSLPNLTNIQSLEIFIYPGNNWGNSIVPITNIDASQYKIFLAKPTSQPIKPHNRFFLQNAMVFLDAPGEWYFDDESKMLFFWPPTLQMLNSVYIPVINNIVLIKEKTKNIRIENFIIEECKGTGIIANGTEKITLASNQIRNVGDKGIEMRNITNNWIIANEIYSTGGIGILVSGGDYSTLSPGNNRIINNYIHHTGFFVKGESALLCRGVGNIISHNLIHSIPRIGIWFDGNEHLIEYNEIYDVNMETQDSGIIYCSAHDWTKRGTIIRYNYLHESGGYGYDIASAQWKRPYDTYGIYLDDWASGTKVNSNIITDTVNGAVMIHGGRDNIIENNIFINSKLYQATFSAWPPNHPNAKYWLPIMMEKLNQNKAAQQQYPALSSIKNIDTGSLMVGNNFLHNIIYFTSGEYLYGIFNDMDFTTSKFDSNIIFHQNSPIKILFKISSSRSILSWNEWRRKGFEKLSIIADPLFKNLKFQDFSFLSESPALQLGFQTIPMNKIGRYNVSAPPPVSPENIRVWP